MHEKNDKVCRLCLSADEVASDEHIPPKSTGNRGWQQVEVVAGRPGSPRWIRTKDGVALRVLCNGCNTKMGGSLGSDFASLAQQVQESAVLAAPAGGVYVAGLDLKPARVIRHLMLNFLCLLPATDDGRWDVLRRFIQSPDVELPSNAPDVGLYHNRSKTYRLVGIGSVTSLGGRLDPWVGAEVAAPGLGVVFSLRHADRRIVPAHPNLRDVTEWAWEDYSARRNVVLRLASYEVVVPHPLAFGTRREVSESHDRYMIAWLTTPLVANLEVDPSAMVWRPAPLRRRNRKRRR